MSQYPPGAPGAYPPNQGGYPPSPGYPHNQGYPPNAGGYPPNQGGYPQSPGYPPNQGYPPNTGGYPPNQGGYPPNQGGGEKGYPPNAGGYPPNMQNPPVAPGYAPPNTGSYPPGQPYPNAQTPQGGFPPGMSPNQEAPQGGYPPTDKLQKDSEPGAPPLSELTDLPGYEGLTFDNSALKPPTYEESVVAANVPKEIFQNAPSLTEEEARASLLEYVSKHCCYGSGAAKNMSIVDIRFNSAIHYKLETFGEKRETAWAFEPYKGQQTMMQAGATPGPWEIIVPNEVGNFINSKKEVEVPNTMTLRPCHKCLAMGRVQCRHCFGMGSKSCTWCNGRGQRTQFEKTERCHSCNGMGRDRCTWCHGTGQKKCSTCDGHCQLRYYVKLTVTWENHTDDQISNTQDFPQDLIRGVSGQLAFQDEQPRVWPVSNFPDQNVNTASHSLINKHKTAFPNEHILMQRQQVRIVPIAEVDYSWKSTDGKFFVYGSEKQVHFPNYPQPCCCGCQIL